MFLNSVSYSSSVFTGAKTVTVRYAAHDQYVASETKDYSFKDLHYTAQETYLPLQHVSLHKFSSEQYDSDQAAKNLIDGQRNTKWHSKWDVQDKKEFSVKFDKARHISKLEYVPSLGGKNGRWKEIQVLGSNDGENWTKLGNTVHLADDDKTKDIKVESEQSWQYIKVQGIHSYSHDGNEDKYFTGSMLNFFEDTTKTV